MTPLPEKRPRSGTGSFSTWSTRAPRSSRRCGMPTPPCWTTAMQTGTRRSSTGPPPGACRAWRVASPTSDTPFLDLPGGQAPGRVRSGPSRPVCREMAKEPRLVEAWWVRTLLTCPRVIGLAVSEMMCFRQGRAHLGEAGDLPRERGERLQPVDNDVAVPPHLLESAPGEEQRLAANKRAVALVGARRDNQVDETQLVLQQHEDDSLRCRRALAGDGEPGHCDA